MEPRLILRLRDVSRSFKHGATYVPALRGVSLSLERGSFVGLAGPSGSGKTTLLNIAGLTDAPNSGCVEFLAASINFADERRLMQLRRAHIGYVFQAFNLVSSMTAEENVILPLLLNGVSFDAALERSRRVLSEIGLSNRLAHFPSQLSGGEMQRVAFCRATVHHPALVLADEPTGNLDSQAGKQVIDLLISLAREGTAVLMASHSEHALAACNRIVRLQDGLSEEGGVVSRV